MIKALDFLAQFYKDGSDLSPITREDIYFKSGDLFSYQSTGVVVDLYDRDTGHFPTLFFSYGGSIYILGTEGDAIHLGDKVVTDIPTIDFLEDLLNRHGFGFCTDIYDHLKDIARLLGKTYLQQADRGKCTSLHTFNVDPWWKDDTSP